MNNELDQQKLKELEDLIKNLERPSFLRVLGICVFKLLLSLLIGTAIISFTWNYLALTNFLGLTKIGYDQALLLFILSKTLLGKKM